MNENQQITYMQVRLIRLASEEWNRPIKEIVSIFTEWKVLQFIRECFDIFHVEGDEAILDDVSAFLQNRGVKTNANN